MVFLKKKCFDFHLESFVYFIQQCFYLFIRKKGKNHKIYLNKQMKREFKKFINLNIQIKVHISQFFFFPSE